tara:strand:- start:548 stop:769 length:222 start_codon:yes stop_codon:yes gene_type:complete
MPTLDDTIDHVVRTTLKKALGDEAPEPVVAKSLRDLEQKVAAQLVSIDRKLDEIQQAVNALVAERAAVAEAME